VLYSQNLPKCDEIDEEFLKMNPQLDCYLNVINNDDRITEYDEDEEQSDEDINYDVQASALRVIEDIENKQIFDDIRIDFDSIVDNIAPEDNPSRLNQMLVSYYEEIHEVLQKRLEECQDIIQEYMTQMIESKKMTFQKQFEDGSNKVINSGKSNFSQKNGLIDSVTSEHSKRLGQLREQYEEFLKNAENEFFNVLRSVKGGTETTSDMPYNISKEHRLQEDSLSQQDFYPIEEDQLQESSNSPSPKKDSIYQTKTSHPKPPTLPKDTPKFSHSPSKSLYLWGSGKDGRLANLLDHSEPIPFLVKTSFSPIQLECGYHHSAVVAEDGELFTWGRGVFGQLGHGDSKNLSSPKLVESLGSVKIKQVTCGWQHTMALSWEGKVFSWGYGEDGQLGHGNTEDFLTPKLVWKLKEMVVEKIA
jgi:hypothetical protein